MILNCDMAALGARFRERMMEILLEAEHDSCLESCGDEASLNLSATPASQSIEESEGEDMDTTTLPDNISATTQKHNDPSHESMQRSPQGIRVESGSDSRKGTGLKWPDLSEMEIQVEHRCRLFCRRLTREQLKSITALLSCRPRVWHTSWMTLEKQIETLLKLASDENLPKLWEVEDLVTHARDQHVYDLQAICMPPTVGQLAGHEGIYSFKPGSLLPLDHFMLPACRLVGLDVQESVSLSGIQRWEKDLRWQMDNTDKKACYLAHKAFIVLSQAQRISGALGMEPKDVEPETRSLRSIHVFSFCDYSAQFIQHVAMSGDRIMSVDLMLHPVLEHLGVESLAVSEGRWWGKKADKGAVSGDEN